MLVLFTDGVTDTVGDDGRFGEERLVAALRGVTDAAGAVAAIERALNAFQLGGQADDTAVLAASTCREDCRRRGRRKTRGSG